MEDDTLSLKELLTINLTKMPEQESLQILDNNFPCCYIIRIGDSLEITLEEHIYTKYWFHKYHASVFAEAMIKAVKRLATEGFPYFSEELDNDDDVHLFVRWALAESIHIPNQTLIDRAVDFAEINTQSRRSIRLRVSINQQYALFERSERGR